MKRGFTLLEVMFALSIFALASIAILQITCSVLNYQNKIEEQTVAGWVVENHMTLLYLMDPAQRATDQHGEEEMAGILWYWRTVPLKADNTLIKAVDIDVSRQKDFSSVVNSGRAWFSADEGALP